MTLEFCRLCSFIDGSITKHSVPQLELNTGLLSENLVLLKYFLRAKTL